MEVVARVFEAAGVFVIIVGVVHTFFDLLIRRFEWGTVYDDARRSFGRPLILGLEILVAADVIQTVTVDLSLESIATLGVLVLVRVVLSFSLDIEVDGMVPWRRAEFESGRTSTGP